MADNIAITPGAGATVATDDIGGVQYQRVKTTFGADGTATDVDATHPMPVTVDGGTLTNRIEMLELTLRALLAGAAGQPHDGQGRTRVSLEASPIALTVTGTVSSVAAVGAWGGYSLPPIVPTLMNGGFDALRRGITVS